MKPYMNLSGKGYWSAFWVDKVPKKFRRVYSKSFRQLTKNGLKRELDDLNDLPDDKEKC